MTGTKRPHADDDDDSRPDKRRCVSNLSTSELREELQEMRRLYDKLQGRFKALQNMVNIERDAAKKAQQRCTKLLRTPREQQEIIQRLVCRIRLDADNIAKLKTKNKAMGTWFKLNRP